MFKLLGAILALSFVVGVPYFAKRYLSDSLYFIVMLFFFLIVGYLSWFTIVYQRHKNDTAILEDCHALRKELNSVKISGKKSENGVVLRYLLRDSIDLDSFCKLWCNAPYKTISNRHGTITIYSMQLHFKTKEPLVLEISEDKGYSVTANYRPWVGGPIINAWEIKDLEQYLYRKEETQLLNNE